MKIVKILLWLVLVLVVLAVGAVFVITNLVDPNAYKPRIEKFVELKIERQLDLKGDLSFTWFPSIGVATGPLSVSNSEGFGDESMLSVNNVIVQVELLPLLKKQIKVDTVILDTPQIRLSIDANGITNWDDLIAASHVESSRVESSAEQAGAIAGLAVQGVSIKDGQVSWSNAQTQQDIQLTNLNLATGTLVPGEPLDIDLSVNASGSPIPEPAQIALNTTVIVSQDVKALTLNRTTLSVVMQSLKGNINAEQLNYDLQSGIATGSDLVANLDQGDVKSSIKVQAIVFDGTTESLDIPQIEVNQEGARIKAAINATTILSQPNARGTFELAVDDLRELLERNKMPLEVSMLKSETVLNTIASKGSFSYDNALLKFNNFVLSFDINALPTVLNINALSFNHKNQSYSVPSFQLEQADFKVSGGVDGVGVAQASGQIDLNVIDPVALFARNGLDVELPEIPLNNIHLASNISFENNMLTVDGLTTNFDHREQATQINLPYGELNLQSGSINIQSIVTKQGEASIAGDVVGAKLFDGLEEIEVAGELKVSVDNVVELLERNQIPVEIPEGMVTSVNSDFQYKFANNSLSINQLNAAIDKTQIKGSIAINNLAKPNYRFNLTADYLNVDELTTPTASNEEKPSTVEQVLLPVASLKGLDVDGKIAIGELITTGMVLNDVALNVNSDEDKLRVAPLTAKAFGGTVELQLLYDVSKDTPTLKAITNVRKVDVGALLNALEITEKIKGRGNFNTNLGGQGATVDQLIQSLDGGIDFHLIDGAIKGYDLQATLLDIEKKIESYQGKEASQKEKPDAKTRFAELSGSFQVENGVFNNQDLTMKAPLFRVTGNGKMDMPKSRVDYKLDVNIVETVEGQGGADLGDLKGSWVPFKIYGTLDDLSYVLDVGKILEYRAKKEIKRKLLEELGANNQSLDQNSEQSAPKEKDPVKALGDEVGNKLKDSLLKGLGL